MGRWYKWMLVLSIYDYDPMYMMSMDYRVHQICNESINHLPQFFKPK